MSVGFIPTDINSNLTFLVLSLFIDKNVRMMRLLEIKIKYKSLIKKVNREIIKSTHINQSLLSEALESLALAGGKRIRPILMIQAAQFGKIEEEKMIKIAAALELLHMATLVHDDIIDEARMRRSQVTVQRRFGKDTAVFVGDFLLSKAYDLFARHISLESLIRLNKTVKWICLGETDQYQGRYDPEVSVTEYLKRIRRKTALLLGFSAFLGGYESGVRGLTLYNLYNFGLNLGMVFQIQDDIIDFIGNKQQAGKGVGKDLAAGIYTLPLIYILKDLNFSKKIKNLLKKEVLTEEDIQEITSMIINNNFIEKSQQVGAKYLNKAYDRLNLLPANQVKQDMHYILDQQLTRKN